LIVNLLDYLNDKFKIDPINDNDKTKEKFEYCNKNLNELGMNEANTAYKNRLQNTKFEQIVESIEINN
jgi:hypothetical protein